MADERLLRLEDTLGLVGLSRAEVYRRIAAGTFPAPVQITPRVSRFVGSEVQQWITEQVTTKPRLRRAS